MLGICALIAAAVGAVPAAASAEVKIYDDAGHVLGKIEKAKCRKHTNPTFFKATSPERAPYVLEVTIGRAAWQGFSQSYVLYYGDRTTSADLFGPGGALYSNFALPGTPPGTVAGGAINFDKGGKEIGVGLDPAVSADGSSGVIFGGTMKCKYPKRKP
jgi:hypothetical protein